MNQISFDDLLWGHEHQKPEDHSIRHLRLGNVITDGYHRVYRWVAKDTDGKCCVFEKEPRWNAGLNTWQGDNSDA